MAGPGGSATASGSLPAGPLVGALVLLVCVNLLNNVVAPGSYLLWTTGGVVGLALLARADGLRRARWGLGRVGPRAAAAAIALSVVVAAVMLVATRVPGVASAYVDQRLSGLSPGRILFFALVRAPLGTSLLEEVAFRGVLLAMLARRIGVAWGVVVSSAAFGVWHVTAALDVARGNEALASAFGAHPLGGATAAVVAAGFAGGFLCLLRIRYDHLVVPWAVHATANCLAYLMAGLVVAS